MSDKKKNIYLSIGIIFLGLLIITATYAYLIVSLNVTNGNYLHGTACFDINYDITNDDATTNITGTLFPSSSPKGGLSGNVSIGIDESCNINATGDIYLQVTDVSSILTNIVLAHCENSKTLRTLTDYTTSSTCTSQTDGIWVTNGTALKYAVYSDASYYPLKVGYITGTGSINLYGNFSLNTTLTKYYVYIWLDGNLADNSYASLQFDGYIYADAMQVG